MVGLLVSSVAAAETAPDITNVPEMSDSQQTEAKTTTQAHQDIQRAKELIKNGEFNAAHALLTELLQSDAHRTETLLLLHELSQYWTTQGVVLTKAAQPVQPTPAQGVHAASAPPTDGDDHLYDSIVYGFASGRWFGGVFEIENVAGVVVPSLRWRAAVWRLSTEHRWVPQPGSLEPSHWDCGLVLLSVLIQLHRV